MSKPRGAARDWSDAQLDDLSRITQADIERAQEAWKRDAPEQAKNLLDAVPDDDVKGEP